MTVAEWIITAGAVVAAIGVIHRAVLYPIFKWAQRLENAVSHVESNMKNNGGTSMRDAIDRIEKRLTTVEDYITKPK
jgi:hypothetical protein